MHIAVVDPSRVALKVIAPAEGVTRRQIERFVREWNAAFCLVTTRLLTRFLGGELAWAEVQRRLVGRLGLPDEGPPAPAADADDVARDLEKMSIKE